MKTDFWSLEKLLYYISQFTVYYDITDAIT